MGEPTEDLDLGAEYWEFGGDSIGDGLADEGNGADSIAWCISGGTI